MGELSSGALERHFGPICSWAPDGSTPFSIEQTILHNISKNKKNRPVPLRLTPGHPNCELKNLVVFLYYYDVYLLPFKKCWIYGHIFHF